MRALGASSSGRFVPIDIDFDREATYRVYLQRSGPPGARQLFGQVRRRGESCVDLSACREDEAQEGHTERNAIGCRNELRRWV